MLWKAKGASSSFQQQSSDLTGTDLGESGELADALRKDARKELSPRQFYISAERGL